MKLDELFRASMRAEITNHPLSQKKPVGEAHISGTVGDRVDDG